MSERLRFGDPEDVGMSPERVRQAVCLARGWVEAGATPALAVAVVRRGVLVLHEAFGRLTGEADAPPLALDSIFPIASISKTMTATLAMILVEDGLLGLNRPVVEYLPEFVGEGKEMVMGHHLLTHTSGLRDEEIAEHAARKLARGELPPLYGEAQSYLDSHPDTAYLFHTRHLYDAPLWKSPGIQMSYCSLNYEMLGAIVERVSGKPIEEFARERIFRPLGMDDTSYVMLDSFRDRVVRRPVDHRHAVLGAPWLHATAGASWSVLSTARDLATFGATMAGGGNLGGARILSRASVGEMTRNQIPGIGASFEGETFPEAAWSYGWNVEGHKTGLRKATLASPATISHEGAGGSYLWIDPAYDLVGVFLQVVLDFYATTKEKWNADLFANAVTAAIVDQWQDAMAPRGRRQWPAVARPLDCTR